MSEKAAAVEAILFAAGESVAFSDLLEALELSEDELTACIKELNERYREGGIQLIRVGTDYQLTTNKAYYEYVRRIMEPKRQMPLSHAALEVLSVVAYKQPVTRGQIDYIRGVDSSSSMSRLIASELIETVGTSDAPGRPSLYGTTKEFLRVFGLEDLKDLPELGEFEKELELMEVDQLSIDDEQEE